MDRTELSSTIIQEMQALVGEALEAPAVEDALETTREDHLWQWRVSGG